jgi:hypothetical protein
MGTSNVRKGLAMARRHRGAVLVVYLVSLVPALLILSLLHRGIGPALGGSVGAERILAGEWLPVWINLLEQENGIGLVLGAVPGRLLLAVLLQVVVAAGVVEVLLERRLPGERPFWIGTGQHSGRFLRSLGWFLLVLLPVVLFYGLARFGGGRLAEHFQDGRIALATTVGAGLVAFLLYAFVDLAYDLSRLAAAVHGDGRTRSGLWRALAHLWRHKTAVLTLHLPFSLPLLLLAASYPLVRGRFLVDSGFEVAVVLVLQQGVFLLQAFLKVAFWGAEISYYRALGEPRWCAGRQPAAAAAAPAAASPEPAGSSPSG